MPRSVSNTLLSIFVIILCLVFSHGCSRKIPSSPPEPGRTASKPVKPPATSRPYIIAGKQYTPLTSSHGFTEKGIASWYGKKFHGRKTANGEIYNMYAMTAAHKTLPMDTWVRVYHLENKRHIEVRVNDRGPFVHGRIIDLSYTGAQKLGITDSGTAPVKIVALGKATAYSEKTSRPVKFNPVDYWKGNFTIQVGAFTVRDNAVNFKSQLARRFKNVHIVTHTDGRGTFYRVRIMKFTQLKKAMRFAEKYINAGYGDALVVAE